ncbi:polyphosphate polymerase domain-containing protein [Planococcus sp. CAU13]|uniref:polyphosphate polymerase domain-containing protein n=1 Tax=Planococcus sp. CAU13 TaxID=1541197 RepID=UPI00052FE6B4|nr:polyphosphate polymerase domain-containing protein [Planococcus sp. CAU13]
MAIEIFSRKEQKYLIKRSQYHELVRELAPYMRNDKNGVNGRYTVSSLYFDTLDKTIYFETKNKVKYRQKLRLRVYGEIESAMKSFFEIKQKHDKVVHKRRLTMELEEANRYLMADAGGNLSGYRVSNLQVLKEIDYFRNLYGLAPEMVVSYDRHALHGQDDANLRMTFDFNLRCRKDELDLAKGSHGDFFMDADLVVLEVKVDHSVPLWLARILQKLECEQRSASKFCASTEMLAEELILGAAEKETAEI